MWIFCWFLKYERILKFVCELIVWGVFVVIYFYNFLVNLVWSVRLLFSVWKFELVCCVVLFKVCDFVICVLGCVFG